MLRERTTLLLANLASFLLGSTVFQLSQRYSGQNRIRFGPSSDKVGVVATMDAVNVSKIHWDESVATHVNRTASAPPSIGCDTTKNITAQFEAIWPQMRERMCPNMRPDRPLGDALFSLARDEVHMVKWEQEDQGEKFERHHKDIGASYAFASGGIGFIPPSGSPFVYARIYKAANDQIGDWGNKFYPGPPWKMLHDQYFLSTLLDSARNASDQPPCIVTAIRDPISHFLSGYNEIEFRYVRDPSRMPNPPALLYTRYEHGSTQRFEQFVADYVGGPKREKWDYYLLQISHVFSMSGVLTVLAAENATLTDYLPSLNNLTEAWPEFVAKTCPSMAEQIQKAPTMKMGGQHDSSSDPFGFYNAAKAVWKQQGPTARALCALHAMDYACWEKLPDGVPDLCKEVYIEPDFVERIMMS